MVGAVIKNETVINIIVMDESQIDEMARGLGHEIVDARPYGLAIGDVRQNGKWVRNVNGDNVTLTEQEPPDYSGYTLAMEKVAEMKEQVSQLKDERAVMEEQLGTYKAAVARLENERAVMEEQLGAYKAQMQKAGAVAMEAHA